MLVDSCVTHNFVDRSVVQMVGIVCNERVFTVQVVDGMKLKVKGIAGHELPSFGETEGAKFYKVAIEDESKVVTTNTWTRWLGWESLITCFNSRWLEQSEMSF
ncbi:uncharacterized protein A4U43_C01F19110 [Asparagus officinalis]|uniref:Uncharacterized protein n=1 Tax=Asparagus officinalis TaxID=4686 RepID=A0A5P1FR45_ASPOF|nr:uncharacterized protein A4U43_C01F19110 [Asparagus officinalis]